MLFKSDRSSETVADNKHFIKPGFPKPEPCHLELPFCVVKFTSLVFNASEASSAVLHQKWRWKLFAVYKSQHWCQHILQVHHEQKITCGAEDKVPADTHQEDSRILKTE